MFCGVIHTSLQPSTKRMFPRSRRWTRTCSAVSPLARRNTCTGLIDVIAGPCISSSCGYSTTEAQSDVTVRCHIRGATRIQSCSSLVRRDANNKLKSFSGAQPEHEMRPKPNCAHPRPARPESDTPPEASLLHVAGSSAQTHHRSNCELQYSAHANEQRVEMSFHCVHSKICHPNRPRPRARPNRTADDELGRKAQIESASMSRRTVTPSRRRQEFAEHRDNRRAGRQHDPPMAPCATAHQQWDAIPCRCLSTRAGANLDVDSPKHVHRHPWLGDPSDPRHASVAPAPSRLAKLRQCATCNGPPIQPRPTARSARESPTGLSPHGPMAPPATTTSTSEHACAPATAMTLWRASSWYSEPGPLTVCLLML